MTKIRLGGDISKEHQTVPVTGGETAAVVANEVDSGAVLDGINESSRDAVQVALSMGQQVELSPERERMLGLLLTRYDENLDKGLYTAESAPRVKVEQWLKSNPTFLDTVTRWEARGGMPMFTGKGEREGTWQIDECSPEVPTDVRNICYGPNAAKEQGLGEDRNALTQAERLGGTLMTRKRHERLASRGIIIDWSSWGWVLDPENKDLVMEGEDVKHYGSAWLVGQGIVRQNECGYSLPDEAVAFLHDNQGGLRCSLTGDRP